jgi:cyclopropane-fatty-acyl-phospholipid synthase
MSPGTATQFWFRQRVRRQLQSLQSGSLTVEDSWGRWQAGDDDGLAAYVVVSDPCFYTDVALHGSLGAAESWVAGRWHSEQLTATLRVLLRNLDRLDALEGGLARVANVVARLRHWKNRNSKSGSANNIHAHYDIGNDLFELFLDESLTYSCAVYADENASLADAQFEKLDRICRKLALSQQHHVLEIGTGWGSFAIHAARHYGCRVTTTTISAEQHALAVERVEQAGLSDKVEILLADYRDLKGQFDQIVSIEMIEAVGHDYLGTYFESCARLLREDGAMLLQGITMPDQRYAEYLRRSDFIQMMIFPGSCCPALTAMLEAVNNSTDMRVAHVEDIGPHYARTLRTWCERFDSNIEQIKSLGYSDAFIRLWRYYLCYCEAGFAERYTGTVQLLLEKPSRRADAVSWLQP